MFTKKLAGSEQKSMLQHCMGATNATTLHKNEKVMSKGGCPGLQSAQNWKSTIVAGVKPGKLG